MPSLENAFYKKPICISHPSSWREVYSQLDEESLVAYATHHRDSAN